MIVAINFTTIQGNHIRTHEPAFLTCDCGYQLQRQFRGNHIRMGKPAHALERTLALNPQPFGVRIFPALAFVFCVELLELELVRLPLFNGLKG